MNIFIYVDCQRSQTARASTNGSSLSYDQLIHLNQKDVVVATSFFRYGTETIEMVKFCCDHGVSVIAITDDSASPIAAAADI